MMKFNQLGLSEELLHAVEDQGFSTPTAVQAKTIPLAIEGRDIIAGSKTGSGKTLAFGSVMIERSHKGKGIQGLVLTPTRELAEQVSMELRKFSKHKRLSIATVYGGVSIDRQIDALKRADIVVGTPGRMLDHLERRTINLSHVCVLALDEADQMLDMGFIDDVQKIIKQCPSKRQTLLFSATLAPALKKLSQKHMKNPEYVSIETHVDASKLSQLYYDVKDNVKFSLLVHLLKQEKGLLTLVFCNSRKSADFIAHNLVKNGFHAVAIHGGLTQPRRTRIIQDMHDQKIDILTCTDVAARGLHIEGVTHVFNYDAPNDTKQYVHRIGRTARAGKDGKAISLVGSRDHENFGKIFREHGRQLKKVETPRTERVQTQVPTSKSRSGGGFRDGRSSGGFQGGHRNSGFKGRGSGGFKNRNSGSSRKVGAKKFSWKKKS